MSGTDHCLDGVRRSFVTERDDLVSEPAPRTAISYAIHRLASLVVPIAALVRHRGRPSMYREGTVSRRLIELPLEDRFRNVEIRKPNKGIWICSLLDLLKCLRRTIGFLAESNQTERVVTYCLSNQHRLTSKTMCQQRGATTRK